MERRPGWLTYTLVAVFFIAGAYPLYWTVIIGSSDKSALTDTFPPLLPGGQFWKNVAVVFDTVPFWQALMNSSIVSTVVAASVVFFSAGRESVR